MLRAGPPRSDSPQARPPLQVGSRYLGERVSGRFGAQFPPDLTFFFFCFLFFGGSPRLWLHFLGPQPPWSGKLGMRLRVRPSQKSYCPDAGAEATSGPQARAILALTLALPSPARGGARSSLFLCSLPFLPASDRCLPGNLPRWLRCRAWGSARCPPRSSRPSLGKHTRPSATAAALIKSAVVRTSCPNPIPPFLRAGGGARTPRRAAAGPRAPAGSE